MIINIYSLGCACGECGIPLIQLILQMSQISLAENEEKKTERLKIKGM